MAIVAVAAREAASQKPTRSSQAKGARSQGGRAWPSWVPEVPYKKKPTSWPFKARHRTKNAVSSAILEKKSA